MATTTTALRAVSYRRVSTTEQATSGLGLDAQAATIDAAVVARGWAPLAASFTDEGVSGKLAPEERPALAEALAMLDAGDADVLVVAKLDRLTRSMGALSALLERAERARWSLVILDADVDTTTAGGRLVANVLGSVAEWERMVIAERTKAALAAKKAAGVRLGRPVTMDADTRETVAALRADGLSLAKVSDELNARGLVNGQGRPFTRSLVAKIDRSLKLDAQATA